ncbi:MAG: CAP domain-containing protein [Myxococcota bacterium]
MLRSTAVVLVLLASSPLGAQPAFDEDRDFAGEAEIVARMNELRATAGLAELARDTALDRAAAVHSRDMAAHRELVHVSERTGNPAERVRNAGLDPRRVGENVAQAPTALGAYEQILASEAHRAQLLDPAFTHFGIAAVAAEDGVYLTQVLAQLPEAAPLAPAPAPGAEALPLPPPSLDESPSPPPDPVPQLETGIAPNVAPAGPPLPPNAPLLRVPVLNRPVRGYWVWHANRWWYFDVPPTARAGDLLRPNLDVTGPPPGYAPAPPPQGQRIQVWHYRSGPPVPLWRTPRRRVYWY